MRNQIDMLLLHISPKEIFDKKPIVRFFQRAQVCDNCGSQLIIRKTKTRTIATLEIGEFEAHETDKICPLCHKIVQDKTIEQLVPKGGKYGFDVIEYIGRALFLKSHGEEEIKEELSLLNISISLSEIGYLGKKFIIYLFLSHKECENKLKGFMKSCGGYILHIDATCEGDSPHLMSALDGISNIVLNNVNLKSENSEDIIPFLEEIKAAYGNPIANVHDMGKGILKAIETVFPGIKDFICHFHFLADLGSDLFGYEYNMLRKGIKAHCIKTKLRESIKKIKEIIDANVDLTESLSTYLKNKQPDLKLKKEVSVYVLLVWVLEATNDLNGYGFPFDRQHLGFYQRLKDAFKVITNLSHLIL